MVTAFRVLRDTKSVPHKKSNVNGLEQLSELLTSSQSLACCVKAGGLTEWFTHESVAGGHIHGDFVTDSPNLSATDGIFGLIDPAMEGILLEYRVESPSGSRYEVQMLEMCLCFSITHMHHFDEATWPPYRNGVFFMFKCNIT